jgi:hypothetical protein
LSQVINGSSGAQNSGNDYECSTIHIVNGIQISVNSAPPKDGVTNHIITFQVPNQDNFQNSDNTQVILEQVDLSQVINGSSGYQIYDFSL